MKGRTRRAALVASAVAGLSLPGAVALGQYGYGSGTGTSSSGGQQQPAADVKAEGNAFTGGLKFDPPKVSVKVGQIVRWTNTDKFVPHTATEDHGLWDLAGTYGMTPANPAGFGPGETRTRVFEAGTEHYYCRVHPQQMHGVVAVPVALSRTKGPKKNGTRKRLIFAKWAAGPPVAGQVFDVQVMQGKGKWKALRSATRAPSAKFGAGKSKTLWSVRARLRKASDASAATDWSPVASIKS